VASPYLVPVAQLLRDVPSTLDVDFEAPFDETHEFSPKGPAETDVFGEATVRVRLRLESFNGGLHAKGHVEAPWHGAFVDERGPGDEETYLIENDFVDLAPLVHDAIFLDLPLAPLCGEDCQGLCPYCGIDRNEATCDCQAPVDARWATLDGLRFTGAEPGESNEV
jgi:hypothetical protein